MNYFSKMWAMDSYRDIFISSDLFIFILNYSYFLVFSAWLYKFYSTFKKLYWIQTFIQVKNHWIWPMLQGYTLLNCTGEYSALAMCFAGVTTAVTQMLLRLNQMQGVNNLIFFHWFYRLSATSYRYILFCLFVCFSCLLFIYFFK